jgi:hypothetical protein
MEPGDGYVHGAAQQTAGQHQGGRLWPDAKPAERVGAHTHKQQASQHHGHDDRREQERPGQRPVNERRPRRRAPRGADPAP